MKKYITAEMIREKARTSKKIDSQDRFRLLTNAEKIAEAYNKYVDLIEKNQAEKEGVGEKLIADNIGVRIERRDGTTIRYKTQKTNKSNQNYADTETKEFREIAPWIKALIAIGIGAMFMYGMGQIDLKAQKMKLYYEFMQNHPSEFDGDYNPENIEDRVGIVTGGKIILFQKDNRMQ